jgi:hypothetical protein
VLYQPINGVHDTGLVLGGEFLDGDDFVQKGLVKLDIGIADQVIEGNPGCP